MDVDEPQSSDTGLLDRPTLKREQLSRLLETVGTGCPQVSADGSIPLNADPVACVVFFDSRDSRSYRWRLENLLRASVYHDQDEIQNRLNMETEEEEDDEEEIYQPNCHIITGGTCTDQLNCSCEPSNYIVTGMVEYYDLYTLDWMGCPMIMRGDEWCAPDEIRVIYEQVYIEPFWINVVAEQEEKRLRRVTMTCFNCGGFHHMSKCDQPINPFRVASSRRKYQDEHGAIGTDKRYHMALSHDRFLKFEPGKLSQKLRNALGLDETTHPSYIEQMKDLGYPPGWRLLEEETLHLFNEDGVDIGVATVKQNIKEIIFPGFNDVYATTDVHTAPQNQTSSAAQVDEMSCSEELNLQDYEFREGEEGESFGLVKFMKESSHEMSSEDDSEEEQQPMNNFSLDFPPGYVDVTTNIKPKRWRTIKKLLDQRKLVPERQCDNK